MITSVCAYRRGGSRGSSTGTSTGISTGTRTAKCSIDSAKAKRAMSVSGNWPLRVMFFVLVASAFKSVSAVSILAALGAPSVQAQVG